MTPAITMPVSGLKRIEFKQSWDDNTGMHHIDCHTSEPMEKDAAVTFALFLHQCIALATPAPNPNVLNHKWEIGTI